MRSPVYWHPFTYRLIMRFLYGREFQRRYKAIADLIPAGVSVTEVCAGDAYLYEHYLQQKNITYRGLDINPIFINSALSKKISFQKCDLLRDEVPVSDYVIIHASLYQFIPNENAVIRKLLDAARKFLIIAEPVKNLSDSKNVFISYVAKRSANPGNSHAPDRFNEKTLLKCFQAYPELLEVRYNAGDREMIGVFRK